MFKMPYFEPLYRLVEEQIKKDLKKNVKVNAIRKKPYFQDV